MSNERVNIGGVSYDSVGTTTAPLLLKSNGMVRVLYGGSYIDLIKNGKINSNSNILLKVVDSEDEMLTNGIYVVNDSIMLKIDSDTYTLVNGTTESENYDTRTLKLKDLGLIVDSISDIAINSGIVLSLADGKVYKVINRTPTELTSTSTSTSNKSTTSESTANGISAENSAIVKINGMNKMIFNKSLITVNSDVRFDNGLSITTVDNESVLQVDNLIWNNSPQTTDIIPAVYADGVNVISSTDDEWYKLSYKDSFAKDNKVMIVNTSNMSFKCEELEEAENYYYKLVIIDGESNKLTKYCILSASTIGEDPETATQENITDIYDIYGDSFTEQSDINYNTKSSISDLTISEITITYCFTSYKSLGTYKWSVENQNSLLEWPLQFYIYTNTGVGTKEVTGYAMLEENGSGYKADSLDNLKNESVRTQISTNHILSEKLYSNNLIESKASAFNTLDIKYIIATISEVNNFKIKFSDYNDKVTSAYMYRIKDDYISIYNKELKYTDINNNLYYLIGKYTSGETTYNGYSKNQLLESPTLVNPIVDGGLSVTVSDNPKDTDPVNAKYVKALIDAAIANLKTELAASSKTT